LYEAQEEEDRYRLLETVRQYARDRLLEAAEAAEVRGRHRDWFLALAEQESQRDRFEEEHDNLRAALAWCKEGSEAEAGLRLGVALWLFWSDRGYWTEAREHLAELLALPESGGRTAMRAKALSLAGQLAQQQGEYGVAQTLHEQAVAIWLELGDKRGIAGARGYLAWVAQQQGEYETARVLLEETLAIQRELGDQRGIAGQLSALGWAAAQRGDYEEARTLLEEGLAIHRELGERYLIGLSLGWLGGVARGLGNYEEAQALLEECLAIHRPIRNKRATSGFLWIQAGVTYDQGKYGDARRLYEESLAISWELGYMETILGDLEGLAAVALAQGKSKRAARLLGAAKRQRDASGPAASAAARADSERSVATARAALGEEAFATAWAEGRALSLEEAVAFALGETREA
jgi:tetratricopeptide (TPR) repeat protein